MKEKRLDELIIDVVNSVANNNPAPLECKIIKDYDNGFADIEIIDYGQMGYVKVIGDTTVNAEGIVCFVDGDWSSPIVITSGGGGDLSQYITKSSIDGLVKNDGTIDTTSYSTFDGNYNSLTNKPNIPFLFYGTCSTSASTNPKEVTTSTDFVLSAGTILSVKFEYTQTYNATAEAPLQLVINNQSPINVVLYGSTYSLRYHWVNGEVVHFIYDGNDFRILNRSVASTTYYGLTKLLDSVSSSSTTMSATPNAVKQAYDLADGKADAQHTHIIGDVGNLQTALDNKSDISHSHSLWVSTSLNENLTLYVNEALHLCELYFTRSFSRATEYTVYNWYSAIIPSEHRPPIDSYGAMNNGGVIFITASGDVKGYVNQTLESRFTLEGNVMWHY